MANKTDYKRTLSGSVGAGMKSIFSAGGRSYYILEHKVSSRYHKAGESQEIIVDQIELGRGSKCQVRFDEDFKTVSRRHAAIIKDGDRWKLVQLSTTNKTLLNGQPVTNEWYLQTGDEIQLSVNGPKLGFIVPTGAKATVGSIGLSRRLSLFRQQALRPYKTAMWIMSIVIILLIGCFAGSEIYHYQKEKEWKDEHARMIAEAEEQDKSIDKLRHDLDSIDHLPKVVIAPNNNPTPNELKKLSQDVYFLVMNIKVVMSDGSSQEFTRGTGSGFLLNDGRFVTARHCVEPWAFPDDDVDRLINIKRNEGKYVTCSIYAYSPNGGNLHFETEDFVVNHRNDHVIQLSDNSIMKVADLDCNDYAFAKTKTGVKGNLKIDANLSENLQMRNSLHILGYPLGLGADKAGVSPYYSTAIVARNGLAEGGYIPTTSSSFEQGNSGGPVFVKTKNGYRVVGIVSASAGRSTGFIVPISQIH